MTTRAMELKQKIHEQKDVVVGMWIFTLDPNVIEMCGARKMCDFVILELEHSPYYADRCLECIRAAEVAGVVPVVRVPSPGDSRQIIQKVLDIGAKGLFLPMVRTGAEMRAAIAATRYQPEGTRGAFPSARGCGKFSYIDMKPADWAAKVKELNEEMLVFSLPLETLDGMRNLEDIVTSPGMDCASLSIIDVGHALGHAGDMDHPEVRKAQQKLIDVCKKHNVPTYTVPVRAGQFEYWYEQGCRVYTLCDSQLMEWGFNDFTKSWKQWRRK